MDQWFVISGNADEYTHVVLLASSGLVAVGAGVAKAWVANTRPMMTELRNMVQDRKI